MPSDLSSLETDLPTTAEDIEALRRAHTASRMSAVEIARALEQRGTLSRASLRVRPAPGGEPFELPRQAGHRAAEPATDESA